MAEIPIERRRRSPLPWILGALAVLAILFLLMRARGDGARDRGQDGRVIDTTTAVTPAPTSTAPGGTTAP